MPVRDDESSRETLAIARRSWGSQGLKQPRHTSTVPHGMPADLRGRGMFTGRATACPMPSGAERRALGSVEVRVDNSFDNKSGSGNKRAGACASCAMYAIAVRRSPSIRSTGRSFPEDRDADRIGGLCPWYDRIQTSSVPPIGPHLPAPTDCSRGSRAAFPGALGADRRGHRYPGS